MFVYECANSPPTYLYIFFLGNPPSASGRNKPMLKGNSSTLSLIMSEGKQNISVELSKKSFKIRVIDPLKEIRKSEIHDEMAELNVLTKFLLQTFTFHDGFIKLRKSLNILSTVNKQTRKRTDVFQSTSRGSPTQPLSVSGGNIAVMEGWMFTGLPFSVGDFTSLFPL